MGVPEIVVPAVLALSTVSFAWLGGRYELPLLVVVSRWLRWIFFAVLFAMVLPYMEWSMRPFLVHFLIGGALWFLLESSLSWMTIRALSFSDYPIFPSFRENRDGDDWPAEGRLISIRERLRERGFVRCASLKAHLVGEHYIRSSLYRDEAETTLAQIYFLPLPGGGQRLFFSLHSQGEGGVRFITDNFSVPYGGYFPESWHITRCPLTSSLDRLLLVHERRTSRSGHTWRPFTGDPLDWVNDYQAEVERTNYERGFLVPPAHVEESGKITREGRYRLWKEKWFLDYFGTVAVSYR